ncbi:ATP-dependent helicase/nuclease subunit B [Sphingomonas kaistensis]|uniref:ATP-dependent helicase/nuclease subunit B n=1 Tax=Sphingomonas kaistensis TaxID=298708 RepID=A0A7X5Y778_9SPHN|nr:double-strand break repair protein AddB [Sphingomonas kaistensis]NJC06379.1 ATP-dependent helicase/nuclease subunit B [Sphingomonas kaistensis]
MPASEPRPGPSLWSIPAEASFADALALELISRHGGDPLALARGRVLLPNARAVRTVTEAFVRASGTGLLLPRLIPIGDPSLDERIGGAFESLTGDPIAPAVDPLTRQAELAGMLQSARGLGTAEAWRLAGDLARTLDQLLVEGVTPKALLARLGEGGEIALHQQRALETLSVLLTRWPERQQRAGRIDLVERRNLLLRATARRWQAVPPAGFTVAAGITTSAPAVADLLRVIAFMPDGEVVLPALADETLLDEEQWKALGGEEPDDGRPEPTHPQYHLKLLLQRMRVDRASVRPWPSNSAAPDGPQRSRAAAHALTAASFSQGWSRLAAEERSLGPVRLAILPDPASEAQAIALALREALEIEGRTAALVTPDRQLARRVGVHLRRWGIEADDSAGTPLSLLPPGSLLLALTAAAADRLAPVPLLALLGHPLVHAGETRREWLDDVRALDLALRGPRPLPGVDGLQRLVDQKIRDDRRGQAGLAEVWERLKPVVADIAPLLEGALTLAGLAAGLRRGVEQLAGEGAWSGPAGRAAADLLAALEASEATAALPVGSDDAVPLLRALLDGVAIRPPYGQHPRVRILGLIEARLIKTDLMVLAGLNEGSWPAPPSPDPWLPVTVRRQLKLPGPEIRIGLSAHDFAGLLCAEDVLLTRARRDGRSPTVSSRLLLRLEALTGGLPRDERLEALAVALDDPEREQPALRPRPSPPRAERPKRIRVTDLDRLKADPFSFYAKTMLRLRPLDDLGAEQDAAWKGTIVHALFEQWFEEDQCAPARLLPRARDLLAGNDIHPLMRALWGPRLIEAIGVLAEEEASNQTRGRRPFGAEVDGEADVAGVRLIGRADRIDRLPGVGQLAILDFKTGKPPAKNQVEAGFALQLGLLGLIAEAGGFGDLMARPTLFEYWSLAKQDRSDRRGFVEEIGPADVILEEARRHFSEAAARWLTGHEPFTAKLQPRFARYGDYDQLMRLEEWLGRS